jgi:hypothetical protein
MDPKLQDYTHALLRKKEQLKNLKNQNKLAIKKIKETSSLPDAKHPDELHRNLRGFVPQRLMPWNVGHLNHVAWPFYHAVEFDLSNTNVNPNWPAISNTLRVESSFQVSQESAFIFEAISRHADDYNEPSGDLGPLQIEIRDRQSSRFFNNAPIPIQGIGADRWPTYLATPFLIMPNAFIDVIMSSWLATGVSIEASQDATGKHQFVFHGYRIRIEDANKVLSSIFHKG